MRAISTIFAAALVGLPSMLSAAPAEGVYGGLSFGYNIGDGTVGIPAYVPDTYSVDLTGIGVGGFVGFNFPTNGGFVFGIEAGANLLNSSDTFATAAAGETFDVDGQWEASIVGRFGGMAGDTFIYGLGGASIMSVSGQYNPGGTEKTDEQVGWVIGVGAERTTGTGAFIRGEVRYAEYPTFDLECSVCGPTMLDLTNVTVSLGVGLDF